MNWYADQIPEVMLDELTKKTLEDGTMETATKEAVRFVCEHINVFFE